MKTPSRTWLALAVAALVGAQIGPAVGRAEGPAGTGSKTMNPKMSSSADVVRGFFAAFGKGDADGVINSFHPEVAITAVRRAERKPDQLYGTYAGREGAKAFLVALGKTFDTQAFSVANVIGEGGIAFANGSFVHKVRTTGKPFASDWALMCVVKEGKILEYHFYEDSAAYVDASR
jgi:uncharacterized protein